MPRLDKMLHNCTTDTMQQSHSGQKSITFRLRPYFPLLSCNIDVKVLALTMRKCESEKYEFWDCFLHCERANGSKGRLKNYRNVMHFIARDFSENCHECQFSIVQCPHRAPNRTESAQERHSKNRSSRTAFVTQWRINIIPSIIVRLCPDTISTVWQRQQ